MKKYNVIAKNGNGILTISLQDEETLLMYMGMTFKYPTEWTFEEIA